MRLGRLFGRGAAPRPTAEIARIKDRARAARPGLAEASFTVNEIACLDPACPGIETVVLIFIPGRKTQACKVQKPMVEVTEQDVREAIVGISGCGTA